MRALARSRIFSLAKCWAMSASARCCRASALVMFPLHGYTKTGDRDLRRSAEGNRLTDVRRVVAGGLVVHRHVLRGVAIGRVVRWHCLGDGVRADQQTVDARFSVSAYTEPKAWALGSVLLLFCWLRPSEPNRRSSVDHGSITIVQWTVVGASTPVTVREVSQPVAGVSLPVPVVLSQVIVADVSPEPPSRKFTWMSDSGGSVNVTTAAPVGGVSVQLVPVTTVTVSGPGSVGSP